MVHLADELHVDHETTTKQDDSVFFHLFYLGTCSLQTLVQQCYKYLEKEYVENEPVECYVSGKW